MTPLLAWLATVADPTAGPGIPDPTGTPGISHLTTLVVRLLLIAILFGVVIALVSSRGRAILRTAFWGLVIVVVVVGYFAATVSTIGAGVHTALAVITDAITSVGQ